MILIQKLKLGRFERWVVPTGNPIFRRRLGNGVFGNENKMGVSWSVELSVDADTIKG
jgi:hypothetical protein